MESIWIPITIFAALMQAVRTAAQKNLSVDLSTMVTTYVLSVFGLPFLVAYLLTVKILVSEDYPSINLFFPTLLWCRYHADRGYSFFDYTFFSAQFRSWYKFNKTDFMMTALIGSVLFSESITFVEWIAIILTLMGVLFIAIARSERHRVIVQGASAGEAVTSKPTVIGLLKALFFSLSYLFLREASLDLGEQRRRSSP